MCKDAWICWLLVLLIVVFAGCRPSSANTKQEFRAAAVLFNQFETVFYSERDFLSTYPGPYAGLSEQDIHPIRVGPFWYFLGGLDALGKGTSVEILKSADWVLLGAKDFRGPEKGMGPVRSQVCYVVGLRSGNKFDLRRYFHVAPVSVVPGIQVFNWLAEMREFGDGDPKRPTSLYAAQIESSFLLISNNIEELQGVAEQLSSSNDGSQVLARIREWESVSQFRVWGYRRYRHTDVADKDRHAAGMTDVTPTAEALILLVDLDKKTCSLRLLTSSNGGRTALNWNGLNIVPRFRPLESGVWQSRYSFGDEYTDERTLFVMALLGFGAYL